MRVGIIFLSLIVSTLILFKIQPFLSLKGFSFEKGIESIEIKFKNYKLLINNIKFSRNNIFVGVISVKIPRLKENNYIEKVKSPNYELIKKSIFKFFKGLEFLPINLTVKDIYILQGNTTINLYNLHIFKGGFSLQYGEVFLPNGESFYLENVSLLGGPFYKTFTVGYKFKNLYGFTVSSLNPVSGKIDIHSINKFGKKGISINGIFWLKRNLQGKIYLKDPFGGNWTIELILKGFKGIFSITGRNALVNLYLKGTAEFFPALKIESLGYLLLPCGRKVLISVQGNETYLGFALLDYKDFTYISGNYILGENLDIIGEIKEGLFRVYGNIENLIVKAKSLRLTNLCGLSVENLSYEIRKERKIIKGFLSFSKLYYKTIVFSSQKLNFILEKYRKKLHLEGGISGNLNTNYGILKGNLSGKFLIKDKFLRFRIPKLEINNWKKSSKFKVKFISWDYWTVKNVNISSLWRNKKIKVILSGDSKGLFSYNSGKFFANIYISAFYRGNLLGLNFKGRGTSKSGEGIFSSNDFYLSWSYYRKKENLNILERGYYKLFAFSGKISLKRKKIKFTQTFELKPNQTGITVILTILGEASKNLHYLKGEILPFCVHLVGEKVACFTEGSFKKVGENFNFYLEGLKNFPIYCKVDFKIYGGKKYFLNSLLRIKKSLVNEVITPLGFYLDKPEVVSIPINLKGNLHSIPTDLFWTYTTKLRLFSTYFYKPLDIYLTFSLKKDTFSSFIGLSDALSGTIYGSAFAILNGRLASVDMNFTELPIKLWVPELLKGYLSVGIHLKAIRQEKKIFVNGTILSGGFLKIISYKFQSKKSSEKENPFSHIKLNLNLYSIEPLYVETPEGNFIVNYRGKFIDNLPKIFIEINYGKLNLLGKTFYIHGGEVNIIGKKTYLDIPMMYYTSDRTVYIRIYGPLPWNRLKLNIYSVPPAPKEELLASLVSGGGANLAGNMPLAKILLQSASLGLIKVINSVSSSMISGITIKFVPSFDPTTGFAVGIDIEKQFDDIAKIGYHWFPSPNPKSTYLWGSMRFLYNTYLRGIRYSDGSKSLLLRFAKEFGFPF